MVVGKVQEREKERMVNKQVCLTEGSLRWWYKISGPDPETIATYRNVPPDAFLPLCTSALLGTLPITPTFFWSSSEPLSLYFVHLFVLQLSHYCLFVKMDQSTSKLWAGWDFIDYQTQNFHFMFEETVDRRSLVSHQPHFWCAAEMNLCLLTFHLSLPPGSRVFSPLSGYHCSLLSQCVSGWL